MLSQCRASRWHQGVIHAHSMCQAGAVAACLSAALSSASILSVEYRLYCRECLTMPTTDTALGLDVNHYTDDALDTVAVHTSWSRCSRCGHMHVSRCCCCCQGSWPSSCSHLSSTTSSCFPPLPAACWHSSFSNNFSEGTGAASGHSCPWVALGAPLSSCCCLLLPGLHCAPLLRRQRLACNQQQLLH